jgi:LPS sulfotransferase NodH
MQTVNFVILGTQRTGTTLVRTSLSSHPDILCCGEVFLLGKAPYRKDDGYWRFTRRSAFARLESMLGPRRSSRKFLDQLYNRSDYAAVGFKLMLGHYLSRPYIWPMLVEKDVRAILVRRNNSLKTLVSRKTAAESGVYHISKELKVGTAVESWKPRAVTINTETLVSELDAINAEYVRWRERVGDQMPMLEVVYEDYCENTNEWNDRIQKFLGVSRSQMQSDLKKVNPDDLSKVIANYDDVVQTLVKTEYASYLT